jgi:hypothetical protein
MICCMARRDGNSIANLAEPTVPQDSPTVKGRALERGFDIWSWVG